MDHQRSVHGSDPLVGTPRPPVPSSSTAGTLTGPVPPAPTRQSSSSCAWTKTRWALLRVQVRVLVLVRVLTLTCVHLQVQIFNPAFFKYVHDRWTRHHGRYPSTGMLVLFFALHVCDEVSPRPRPGPAHTGF